jgi:DNA repair protein RecN (Recombination protein N)
MKRSAQRALLDQHGQHDALLKRVSASWLTLKTLRTQLAETERSSQDRNERLSLLRYHLTELEALAPQLNEAAELNAERLRHSQSGKLAAGVREMAELLRDSDSSTAEQTLSRALSVARQMGHIDARLTATIQLLDEALIACREAANAVQHYESELDADPARQEWVEQRLAALESAARKHRVEVDGLLTVQDNCRLEVARLESLEFTLEQLNAQIAVASKQFTADCKDLSTARQQTAASLSERITALMQSLGMPGGRFAAQVRPVTEADANESGSDEVEFMVSANPGQPLKPLAKVASGGELSRISLSIQVAAVESVVFSQAVPTLVFDEVDGCGWRCSGNGGTATTRTGGTLASVVRDPSATGGGPGAATGARGQAHGWQTHPHDAGNLEHGCTHRGNRAHAGRRTGQ